MSTSVLIRFVPYLKSATRWCLIGTSLIGTLLLGLLSKVYDGPFATWVQQDLNGLFYTLAWALGLALLLPRARVVRLAGAAFAISCGFECLQLWHPHWLEVLRAEPLGRLAIGSSFAWSDFPYYGLGAVVAVLWLGLLPFGPRGAISLAPALQRPFRPRAMSA